MADFWMSLHPADPTGVVPKREAVVRTLTAAGLIGDEFDFFGARHFRAGARFFDLVEFPSSPALDVRKVAETYHVHVEAFAEVNVLGGQIDPDFRFACSACGHGAAIGEFPDVIGRWCDDQETHRWQCPRCRRAWRIHELDWQHMIGFARIALDLWGVPGDAVPSAALLRHLRQQTQIDWTYTYVRI